ncbi:MAG: alpha/beta fold hydrolase [Myxococcota bacterium]
MEAIEIPTVDRSVLGATRVSGSGLGYVVIAGATAVPHRFYRSLAVWLAERTRATVLSFDYRGVGASKRGPLRSSEIGCRDWALDLASVIRYAAARGPTVVVGHSSGGHAFGMTDAHQQTLGLYTFGSGAAWHGYMKPAEAIKVWTLWNVLGPPLVGLRGYMPMRLVGLGEDLPKGVYRDWRRWSGFPNYFFDDPNAEFVSEFGRVRVPVVGVSSTDDAWAPPQSVDAFMGHYPRYTPVVVRPEDIRRPIGHMGYARSACRALWDPLAEWVSAQLRCSALDGRVS